MLLSKILKVILKNKREVFKILFLTQIFLVVLTIFYISASHQWGILDENEIIERSNFFLTLLAIVIGLVGITSVYLFKVIVNLTEMEKEYELQRLQYAQMIEANELLRSQKHDYLNNLQVIWGLLALGNIEKTKEYLRNLTDGFKIDKAEVDTMENINCPHLGTLFLNKLYKCKDLDIDIKYNIQREVSFHEFSPIDLVRIFSNLIDNAIYAVKTLNKEERKISVDIYYQGNELIAEVFNIAPIIPHDIIDKIFNKGFTTKGNEGSGMGLYIVKNILQKYKGTIEVISEKGFGTKFIIRLPKK